MFSLVDFEVKQYEKDLAVFAAQGYPFAVRQTLNKTAFSSQSEWRGNVEREFVQRNAFTRRSIQVERVGTGLDVRRMQSEVGSIAPYMLDQELGGTKQRTGSQGVAITTSYAAGQSMNAKPRTRAARKPNRLESIRLQNKRKTGPNRQARNVMAVRQAARDGDRFVFLELQRRKGIFRVVGRGRNVRIRMVHDLTRPSVRIPKSAQMSRSTGAVMPQQPVFYRDALLWQLRRSRQWRGA